MLASLQSNMVGMLQYYAGQLKDDKNTSSKIFLINNFDLILTIFYERQLKADATAPFEDLLRQQIAAFIESQFIVYYPNMIGFVQRHENSAAPPTESTEQLSAEGDKISRHFQGSWKANMAAIHTFVMNSFTNFNNGMEILKQVLTQLLLYYTRFQKCLHKLGVLKNVQDLLVPNAVILQEIKNYSRGF